MKNKVLIISTSNDDSTNQVIDWLTYNDKEFVRINSDNFIDKIFIKIDNLKSDLEFSFNKKKYLASDFSSFWYRRGIFKIKKNVVENSFLDTSILNYLNLEHLSIYNFLFKLLNGKVHINKYSDIFINKLDVLVEAKKAGFNVPNSFITNNFSKISQKKNLITKAFSDHNFYFFNKGEKVFAGAHTKKVNINLLKNDFNYSLFQEMINKRFEIRVFFLHDLIFASAIFSQNDEKTIVDFRNYNIDKPNRIVPIKLPIDTTLMIKSIMASINMNSGSIDIIYDEKKNYVFLEINPVGQFQQVSYPCNYFLEREIAKILK